LVLSGDVVSDIIKLVARLSDETVELSRAAAAQREVTDVFQQMHQRLTAPAAASASDIILHTIQL